MVLWTLWFWKNLYIKVAQKIKNSVVIDGDKVRKLISTDLNYSKSDRIIQLKEFLVLAKLLLILVNFQSHQPHILLKK